MCASATARAAGCVPLNIFQPLSAGITPQQFAYIEEDGTISGYTTQEVFSGNFVGKLFMGPDFKKLVDRVRARFASAKTMKPASSRQISIEQYVIGKGFQ